MALELLLASCHLLQGAAETHLWQLLDEVFAGVACLTACKGHSSAFVPVLAATLAYLALTVVEQQTSGLVAKNEQSYSI